MRKRHEGAAWWQLYVIGMVAVGLMTGDAWLKLSTTGHEVTEVVILAASYGVVALWVRANRATLGRAPWLLTRDSSHSESSASLPTTCEASHHPARHPDLPRPPAAREAAPSRPPTRIEQV